jgi:hypothetical protein
VKNITGIRGDREVADALAALGRGVPLSVVDKASRQALAPMRDMATQNARSQVSKRLGKGLADGFVVKRVKSFGRGRRAYWLAAQGKAVRVAHLFEFGIAFHSMAKGASRRKGVLQDSPPWHPGRPATPILTPAFEAQKTLVPRRFGDAVWVYLRNHVVSLRKGSRRR